MTRNRSGLEEALGLDVLAFTGGVGENAASIRARTLESLRFAGVRLSAEANRSPRLDALVHAEDSAVAVAVVEAREDIEIAREVRAALGAA
jgi:acetate kinase